MKTKNLLLLIVSIFALSSCGSTSSSDIISPSTTSSIKEEVTLTIVNDEHCSTTGSGTYDINSDVTIAATIDEHYEFLGWFVGDALLSKSNPYSVHLAETDMVIYAKTIAEVHEVVVNINDENMGSVSGAGQYSFGQVVTITATPKTGFKFVGFYDEDSSLLSENKVYTFQMESKSIVLEARFATLTRSINVTINGGSTRPGYVKFVVEGNVLDEVNSAEFSIGTFVTMIPVANLGFSHIGWRFNNTILMDTYQEVVVNEDQEWICNFSALEHYDSMSFGTYPQTIISESSGEIFNSLKAYEKDLPTSSSLNGWEAYAYKNAASEESIMFYKDVVIGIEKYRGVYISSFRNDDIYLEQVGLTNQEKNGFELNKVYWFKYEPISWCVIYDKISGELMFHSAQVIDALAFNETIEKRAIETETIYANNYDHSSIRTFMNDAFSDLSLCESPYLKTTLVKNDFNSAGSTGDFKFLCDDTNDTFFLLSQDEAIHGGRFTHGQDRSLEPTDYAKAMGVKVELIADYECSPWYLRSPRSPEDEELNVQYVLADGSTNGVGRVSSTYIGFAPAFNLDVML